MSRTSRTCPDIRILSGDTLTGQTRTLSKKCPGVRVSDQVGNLLGLMARPAFHFVEPFLKQAFEVVPPLNVTFDNTVAQMRRRLDPIGYVR
jgi:hypothetical protein